MTSEESQPTHPKPILVIMYILCASSMAMDMDISPTSARVPENFQESSLVASDLSGPQHGQFGENDTLKSAIFESGSRQVANFWSLSQ